MKPVYSDWPVGWMTEELSSDRHNLPSTRHRARGGGGGSFSGVKRVRSIKLTTHLHLLRRFEMGAAILPLPHTPS
jgi:hypothetical protein